MSIASVSGRLRAQRRAARLAAKAATREPRKWPELSEEERRRQAGIDEAVLRARGGRRRREP